MTVNYFNQLKCGRFLFLSGIAAIRESPDRKVRSQEIGLPLFEQRALSCFYCFMIVFLYRTVRFAGRAV